MHRDSLLQADLLDIIFDGRNKAYGAYTLRKYYPRRLVLSILITAAFTAIVLLLLQIDNKRPALIASNYNSRIVEIKAIEPFKKEPKVIQEQRQAIANKPAVATQKFVDKIRITDQPVQQDPLPLEGAGRIDNITVAGGLGDVDYFPVASGGGGDEVAVVDKVPETVVSVQREPEFPGGMKAWIEFLRRHLEVPSELEAGEKVTVVIRFLVDETGTVTGFETVQSGGTRYDREVMRVLKKMPRWKPAISNNKAVARNFTQPVTFMGIEGE